MKVRDV